MTPDDVEARDTRAHIYEALGQTEDAIAEFQKALQLDPSDAGSMEALKRLTGS